MRGGKGEGKGDSERNLTSSLILMSLVPASIPSEMDYSSFPSSRDGPKTLAHIMMMMVAGNWVDTHSEISDTPALFDLHCLSLSLTVCRLSIPRDLLFFGSQFESLPKCEFVARAFVCTPLRDLSVRGGKSISLGESCEITVEISR